ncbi:MAG: hypothetical protein ACMXYE_02240 [Candidatus Woesearchaeota archaeon]
MAKTKKKLTLSEEFEILKLVLDKFLWIATFMLLYGAYMTIVLDDFVGSVYFFLSGIFVLIVFMLVLIKEYEISK